MKKLELYMHPFSGPMWDIVFRLYKNKKKMRKAEKLICRTFGLKHVNDKPFAVCLHDKKERSVIVLLCREKLDLRYIVHEITHAVDAMTSDEVFIAMGHRGDKTAYSGYYCDDIKEDRAWIAEWLMAQYLEWEKRGFK